MKSFVVALAGVAFVASGTALAADLPLKAPPPAPPPPTWTGFYIGANGGWAWGSNANNTASFATNEFSPLAATGVTFDQHPNGAIFGGQIGYNWQWTNWVFGLEGDFDGANIQNARSAIANTFVADTLPVGAALSEKVEWLATIRGRIGYSWTWSSLFYVTGGGAWERVNFRGNSFISTSDLTEAPMVVGATDFSQTKSGWVAGVGYEYMITPQWTVRGEYLHYGFSNNTVTSTLQSPIFPGGAATGTITQTWKVPNIDAVRVGVNFKFF
jgi:outer membrane immunogenic protein